MHPIFKYLFAYMLLGGIGMYLGSRKKDKFVRRERWIKFFVYILITTIIISAILLNRFIYIFLPVVLICLIELLAAARRVIPGNWLIALVAVIIFLIAASGSAGFSSVFDKAFILFIYFQVFIFDAFCQVTGQLIGKHQLLPAISPAKTVEGLAGGSFFCIVSALVASQWTGFALTISLGYGCLTAASCFFGDMLASWFKRLTGIKDYSKLLPGQGGFLDRFDSLIMTGAVYYFLFGIYGK